ncbi:MAG: hypothetical protein LUG23_06435 [Oscillospiraceae bacterium]|nr:hypothetical protein [Oscillospiraceae bacterium]
MNLDRLKDKFRLTSKQLIYLGVAVLSVILILTLNSFESEDEVSGDSETIPDVSSEYAEELKIQLEEIISKIDGVGDVTVMLTIESSASYVYTTDIDKDELETKTETVIIGNKEALIERIDNPQVSGVLVVCTGGDRAVIQEQVIKAVSTVLDIPSNKVYVAKSN